MKKSRCQNPVAADVRRNPRRIAGHGGHEPGRAALLRRLEIGAEQQPAPYTDLADGCTRAVAQTSSLLYRGFPIRWPRAGRTRLKVRMRFLSRTPGRLEVGDTAGWKPALPGNGRPAGKAAFQTWVAKMRVGCRLRPSPHLRPGEKTRALRERFSASPRPGGMGDALQSLPGAYFLFARIRTGRV